MTLPLKDRIFTKDPNNSMLKSDIDMREFDQYQLGDDGILRFIGEEDN
jgi:hypothetical protein